MPGTASLLVAVALAYACVTACSDPKTASDSSVDVSADDADATSVDAPTGDGHDDGASCVVGSAGCACRPGGGCDDGLSCDGASLCVAAEECQGGLGCACSAGACDEGLACSADTCGVARGVVLRVTGGDARACDLTIITTGRHVARVVYPPGVRGHMWTRDARTAVALMRAADAALSGVVAAVVFDGDEPGRKELVGSLTATCYDRHGARDAAATVTAE